MHARTVQDHFIRKALEQGGALLCSLLWPKGVPLASPLSPPGGCQQRLGVDGLVEPSVGTFYIFKPFQPEENNSWRGCLDEVMSVDWLQQLMARRVYLSGAQQWREHDHTTSPEAYSSSNPSHSLASFSEHASSALLSIPPELMKVLVLALYKKDSYSTAIQSTDSTSVESALERDAHVLLHFRQNPYSAGRGGSEMALVVSELLVSLNYTLLDKLPRRYCDVQKSINSFIMSPPTCQYYVRVAIS